MKKQSLVDVAKSSDDHAQEREMERKLARSENDAKSWKAKYESACEELEMAESRTGIMKAIRQTIPADAIKRLKTGGDAVAVLALSDWHVEERVDPAVINGINSYSPEIATKRVEEVFRRAAMLIDFSRGFSKIDTAVVWLGGDMITGYIHDELMESNFMSPTEAILFVQELIVKGIRFLKREAKLNKIIIPTSFGNHGRTTEKRRVATSAANSHEWLMYHNLASFVKDAGFEWKVENGYFNWVRLFDKFDLRFHHGDNIRFAGGVGGISIPVNKALAQWSKIQRADYDFFGHYHQSIDLTRWTCNGSLIGFNAFALSIKAEPESPSQTLSIISKDRGKVLTMRVFAE